MSAVFRLAISYIPKINNQIKNEKNIKYYDKYLQYNNIYSQKYQKGKGNIIPNKNSGSLIKGFRPSGITNK